MLVRKEIIRPGTYWYTDQDSGLPRKLVVTPAGVSHFFENGQRMLSAGLSIPIPLEHQQEAKPLTAAEKAARVLRNNAGWVKQFEVKDGALFGVLDIQDEDVAKKLPTTIKWTSPWINSFTDGDGKDWNGVISHVALTTRPRITRQQPFPSVAAALSLAGTKPVTLVPARIVKDCGIALSLAGLLTGEGKEQTPLYPNAFQLWSGGARLATQTLPSKGKAKPAPKAPPEDVEEEDEAPLETADDSEMDSDIEDEVADIETTDDMLPPPVPEEPVVSNTGDVSIYDVLCDLLGSVGIQLPPGTIEMNFMDRLYEAVMNKVKATVAQAEAGKQATSGSDANMGADNPILQEQPPMYMSLDDANKLADPKERANAVAICLSLQRTTALEKRVLDDARQQRLNRIARLCKRNPDAQFKEKLTKQAESAQLSLDATGSVVDPMAATLELLEAGIKSLPALLTTPNAQLSENGPPPEYEGNMTEERRKQLVGELSRNGGMAMAK